MTIVCIGISWPRLFKIILVSPTFLNANGFYKVCRKKRLKLIWLKILILGLPALSSNAAKGNATGLPERQKCLNITK
jgi:hypothetical protein